MANAWIRMKHEDYDELVTMLNHVGHHCPGQSQLTVEAPPVLAPLRDADRVDDRSLRW